MQNGKVALQAPVRVNHPLQFGGYVFYQSSYGTSAQITLDVRSESEGEPRQVSLGLGETRPLDPQGRELVRALRYESDYQGRGPAVLLAHMRAPGHPTAGWIFKDGSGSRVEGRVLRLLDARESRWTGLQVKRDPGVWIVWIGCALVMLGCAMAFLLSHRRLWIRIQEERGRTRCRVGASADKGKSTMELWTEGLCAAWAKGVALNIDDRGKGNE
jgi:cytochrome c biogenesis protein